MKPLLLRGGIIAGSLLLVLYGLYDLTRRRMRRQADDSGLALAFELVEGESLAEVLARGPMAPADVRRALLDICGALTAAHARRQVHGDLRAQNVRLTADGAAKVAPAAQADAEATTDADLQARARGRTCVCVCVFVREA